MAVPGARPRPATNLLGKDLEEEYAFYDKRGDAVHLLNATAREIFLLCDGSRSAEEVARALAERFGVDDETAKQDASLTINRLIELGILTLS